MQRLLDDASKISGIKYDISSFADITDAIHVMQEEMGIAGATALEAGTTIQGSIGAMKGAWTNLITGLADGNADIGKLIDNLVTTVVGDGTENNLGVLGNILPAGKTALNGASRLVSEMIPIIVQEIPAIINDNLPVLAEAAISIIQSLVDGVSQNQGMLMTTAFETITYLAESLIEMLPQIVALGLDLIVSLANGIASSLPTLIPTVIDVILQIANTLTDPVTLTNILNAALVLIEELSYGLLDAIPQLVQTALKIVENLVEFILDPANLAKLIAMAFDIIVSIGTGLINAIPELLKSVTRIITGIVAKFKDADWGQIGKDLVAGFKKGIQSAWTSLKTWFENLFGDLVDIAKKILGIASPSKVFKKIGGFTAEGFGVGFDDEFAKVKDDMEDALSFEDASIGINTSVRKISTGTTGSSFGGNSFGDINISIDGAKYSDEQSLASAIALEIQNMTDRRAAVYA